MEQKVLYFFKLAQKMGKIKESMMVAVDMTISTTKSSSPLSTAPQETATKEESLGLSFAEMLHGISQEDESKVVENGALLLALESDEKGSDIKDLKLLLNGDIELNPAITQELTPKEMKVLISKAKAYLKDQITTAMQLSKDESAALPKTLNGLASLASKIGIDISKITLEDFSTENNKLVKTELKADVKDQESISGEELVDTIVKKVKKSPTKKSEIVDDSLRETTKEFRTKTEIKSTPLFKAQSKSEITTQELVNTKLTVVNPQQTTQKQKADDTLKMLLRGEKAKSKESGFSADFSVATARVIAPKAEVKSGSLESLLRGDSQENSSVVVKTDGANVNKADSFEVKLNEAKQMTKYLSQDVKTAIDDYKSPFTRVKVDLNPQKLGSVELTVVQRGKNLHINLSSNNAAINALAMNANDLKIQLQNNGINNASLNFNNNSQSGEQAASQQQQQHHHRDERRADEEYNYFKTSEENEELLNSLEIVVPYYA